MWDFFQGEFAPLYQVFELLKGGTVHPTTLHTYIEYMLEYGMSYLSVSSARGVYKQTHRQTDSIAYYSPRQASSCAGR